MHFDEPFISQSIPTVKIISSTLPRNPSFSIDTRTLQQNDIFVALPGDSVDGHDFVQEAIKKGASGLLINVSKKKCLDVFSPNDLKNKFIALVPDTYNALIDLAKAWRAQFKGSVIGITGSIGKTSTKQLISTILKENGTSHLVSAGTQNTFLGIALNILKLRPEHEVGLFEIGINKRGEMAQKAAMVNPTSAVITFIGHSHMEGLGSINDIAAEKRDIFKCFKEDSIGIINGDYPLLAGVSYPHPVLKFGTKTTNQIQARKIRVQDDQTHLILKIYKEKCPIVLQTNHSGVLCNTLAAVAVATKLGISFSTIVKAIQQPLFVPGRFEQRQLLQGKGLLIHDAFNASPESMKAALLAFDALKDLNHKVAVLGDMLELGVNSPFWHRQLGRVLRKTPSLKEIVLVGDLVQWTKKTIPVNCIVHYAATWQEAVKILQNSIPNNTSILVKGSRGVGLCNLVEQISSAKGLLK